MVSGRRPKTASSRAAVRTEDRRRPDLGHLARVDLAAERQREQLRAEAHAVHRHVGRDGLAQELELRLEPVEAGRVVEALRPAQRDDAVVAGQRGRDRIAGLEVGERDLHAALLEHLGVGGERR